MEPVGIQKGFPQFPFEGEGTSCELNPEADRGVLEISIFPGLLRFLTEFPEFQGIGGFREAFRFGFQFLMQGLRHQYSLFRMIEQFLQKGTGTLKVGFQGIDPPQFVFKVPGNHPCQDLCRFRGHVFPEGNSDFRKGQCAFFDTPFEGIQHHQGVVPEHLPDQVGAGQFVSEQQVPCHQHQAFRFRKLFDDLMLLGSETGGFPALFPLEPDSHRREVLKIRFQDFLPQPFGVHDGDDFL